MRHIVPPMVSFSGKRRAGARSGFAWLTALFAAAFAERPKIPTSTYVLCNSIAGLVVVALGVLMLAESKYTLLVGLGIVASGSVLCVGALFHRAGPAALAKALTVQGFTIALQSAVIFFTSVHWALKAPPASPFRYAPGLVLVMSTYATLLLAVFGPWPQQSRRIRLAGVCTGAVLELGMLLGFAVRLAR